MMFDHRYGGTSEQDWQAHPELADIPDLVLPTCVFQIIVLAAHPDDESLGAGGLMAAAEERQLPIKVFIASDGEHSHPDSTTHTPEDIARIRREEAAVALKTLAPDAKLNFLGFPDGNLHQDAIAQRLSKMIDLSVPTWILAPWRLDGHPDHEACAVAAQELTEGHANVRLLEYPIWAWHWARPDTQIFPWSRCRRLELSPSIQHIKRTALQAYVSQTMPLSTLSGDEPIVTAAMTAHFLRSFETYVETNPSSASAPGYFDELYAASTDPWGLSERFYEVRKREVLMASLPHRRFTRAFEPGCATGLLTEKLATRCDQLLATDIATHAVDATQRRLREVSNVEVALQQIPHGWPTGTFDLIVLSEVGYYCWDLSSLVDQIHRSLSPDGTLVACHWRHRAPAHAYTAEHVHTALGRGLSRIVSHVEDDFLLDIWSRSGESVAVNEGIVA